VEIYNGTDSSVSLDGWNLELRRDDLDFQIPLRGTIASEDYIVVGASEKIPDIDINYANLSGKFVNSGQKIVLRDQFGNVVEEIDARDNWFGVGDNDEKRTMERWSVQNSGNDPENWVTSLDSGGTPGLPNSIFGKTKEELYPSEDTINTINLSGEALKKDLTGSQFNLVHPTTLIVLFIALLSALGILLLRRYLLKTQK